MRIQHNITAMNAYRNYNNNTSAISKNLEKLSSGYQINRAGDDAAGLAVSQKMRLQIAGLEQAQKNAKSAISYVQTAEGSLTEVHDMLERMYTLAEQSANGTFDEETDRVQLQKEANSLMEEIDRIGKTANFNGMGIFAEYAGNSSSATFYEATGTVNGAELTGTDVAAVNVEAQAAVYNIDLGQWEDGQAKIIIDGTTFDSYDTLTAAQDTPTATAGGNYTYEYKEVDTDSDGNPNTYTLVITATKAGADNLELKNTDILKTGTQAVLEEITEGKDAQKVPAHKSYNLTGMANDESITINGKTFTKADTDDADNGKFKDFNGLKAAAAKEGIEVGGTEGAATFAAKDSGVSAGSVSFWVGAENISDSDGVAVNKLTIETLNLGVTNIGAAYTYGNVGVDLTSSVKNGIDISEVDITTAEKAMSFLSTIKDASDAVSDMRGTLGAMQNRLDHTINNLSVMQENMTDAESVIRDTDVAKEMMAYTKNSILVQSAQAMLAQANQLPQGVLQLLQ